MDFWQDIWVYLGSCPVSVACGRINDMWEAKDAMNSGKYPEDEYEFLCWICKSIAKDHNKKLPENLHSRIVLGTQNKYTKEYLDTWGV